MKINGFSQTGKVVSHESGAGEPGRIGASSQIVHNTTAFPMTPAETIDTPATPLHDMRNLNDFETTNNSQMGLIGGGGAVTGTGTNDLSSRPLILNGNGGHETSDVVVLNPDGTRRRAR